MSSRSYESSDGYSWFCIVSLRAGFFSTDVLYLQETIADIEKLKTHLPDVKKVTAPCKYPRATGFVDSLAKTITGRISRNELHEHKMKKFQSDSSIRKE